MLKKLFNRFKKKSMTECFYAEFERRVLRDSVPAQERLRMLFELHANAFDEAAYRELLAVVFWLQERKEKMYELDVLHKRAKDALLAMDHEQHTELKTLIEHKSRVLLDTDTIYLDMIVRNRHWLDHV